jgi:hypothetical protein
MMCDCGHWQEPSNTSPLVATDASGRTCCVQCDAELTAARARRGEPVTLYTTGGGRLTTWPGVVVGSYRVQSTHTRSTRHGWHKVVYLRACVAGRSFYGRSPGEGFYTHLRALKP